MSCSNAFRTTTGVSEQPDFNNGCPTKVALIAWIYNNNNSYNVKTNTSLIKLLVEIEPNLSWGRFVRFVSRKYRQLNCRMSLFDYQVPSNNSLTIPLQLNSLRNMSLPYSRISFNSEFTSLHSKLVQWIFHSFKKSYRLSVDSQNLKVIPYKRRYHHESSKQLCCLTSKSIYSLLKIETG